MSLVGKRAAMTMLSDAGCHYSHRVRIVMAEKDVEADIIHLDPHALPVELFDLNPYGKLPTLVDRELALYEPRVIMEYLDERFPHPPLLPAHPGGRGEARLLMLRIDRDWCGIVDALLAGAAHKTAAKELAASLLEIAPVFTQKQWFMSDDFSLVDCCMAPILWRLPVMGVELPAVRQAKPLFDYMDRLFRRPSFLLSLSPEERAMRGAR